MLKKTILQISLLIFILSIFFIFFNTYFKKEVNTKISIKQINLKKNQSNEIRANLIQKFKYTSSNNEGNSYTISSETGEILISVIELG